MPWYAQRADLPDTHTMWADAGSQHEAVLARLGYVEVRAPGAEEPDEQPLTDEETAAARERAIPVDGVLPEVVRARLAGPDPLAEETTTPGKARGGRRNA